MFNLCTEVFLRSTLKHFWDGLSHCKALPYSEVTDGLLVQERAIGLLMIKYLCNNNQSSGGQSVSKFSRNVF